MVKLVKNALRSKNFHFFPDFVGKLKDFELPYDCSILYFPVVFPVWNIYIKFQLVSTNVSKVIT